MEETLAGLGNRIFLMNNVNDDAPTVFETRWAMSYLRGPLTRTQIKTLMDGKRATTPSAPAPTTSKQEAQPLQRQGASPASASIPAAEAAGPIKEQASSAPAFSNRPVLPSGVTQVFVPLRSEQPAGSSIVYRPMVVGSANVYFNDPRKGLDVNQAVVFGARLSEGPVVLDWQSGEELNVAEADLEREPQPGASFAPVPQPATQAKNYEAWKKSLQEALYRTSKLHLLRSPGLKIVSNPGESERDFRVRVRQIAREDRDEQVDKLRQKFAPKFAAIQERIRKAELAMDVQAKQASASKIQTAISVGATILGAFLGRKTISAGNIGKATTAARGVGRSVKESEDVDRAEQNIAAIKAQLDALEQQLQTEIGEIDADVNKSADELESVPLKPKKSDITVRTVALAWAPHWKVGDEETPAWE
jgi:hypothetical protein